MRVKMYKGDAECTADRLQVPAMEAIGWSLDKPQAEEPKEEKKAEVVKPKAEKKEVKPKKATPKRRSVKKAE
jgi:hypothetical protein